MLSKMLLRIGLAQLSGVRMQGRGVGAIAWPLLFMHIFKSPTLHDPIFLVRTPIHTFLDSMERSLSVESDHINFATI